MEELTPKEQNFIELYTNRENKGAYGNKTESYIQAYGITNRNSAGVLANRLLRKVKVSNKIAELNKDFELNLNKHIETLDRKLTALADKGQIAREELQGYRLLGEFSGKIGGKNLVALQFNFQDGQKCPTCKQVYGSYISPMSIESIAERVKRLREQEGRKKTPNNPPPEK